MRTFLRLIVRSPSQDVALLETRTLSASQIYNPGTTTPIELTDDDNSTELLDDDNSAYLLDDAA